MIKHFWSDRSLFLKLVVVLVLVTFMLNLAVAFFFHRYSLGPRKAFGQFIRGCTHYVLDSLGTPPNPKRAYEISRHLGVALRIESPNGGFSTSPWMLESSQVIFQGPQKGEDRILPQDIKFGHGEGHPYLMLQQGPHRFLVSPQFPMDNQGRWVPLLILLTVISGILGFTWFALRHIFKPLQQLDAGVRQVAQGNLDVQLEATNGDELGHLSESFNQMTRRVRQNLHSKEQLLYNVSHELRSPLARMKLSLEFLPESKPKSSLGEEVRQMEAMIQELLESARLDSAHGVLNVVPVDLALLLKNLCDREQCSFDGPTPLWVQGDSLRLERLFNNLIQNGIKYAPADEPVGLKLSTIGGDAQVEVYDKGAGIPSEEIPYLFEPFYRVDKSRSSKTGGYGLGLSLCKQIAEAHQGQIEVQSQLGQGTRFLVKLPIGGPTSSTR